MDFEWDETKSSACSQVRGFNFAYAAQVFYDPNRLIEPDDRGVYGEDRYQVMGLIGNRLYVVVYTPRDHLIRIISARKANQREVRRYENSTNED
jgi:uncharacterized protein